MAIEVGEAYVSIIPSARGFSGHLNDMLSKSAPSAGTAAGAGFSSGFLSSIAHIGAGILAAMGISEIASKVRNAIGEAFSTTANFEQTQVAFTGLLGSAEAAQAQMKKLQVFARTTPFEFPELAEASKRLLAVGYTTEQVIPIMTNLGNAAAAVGAKGYDINLVIRALGQIKGKGRVMSEEINQIAEALPGFNPLKAIAEETGIAFEDLQQNIGKPGGLLKAFGIDGAQAADLIVKGMEKIPGAMGAMDRQSKTVTGSLSQVRDILREVAVASLLPLFPGISAFIRNDIVPALLRLGQVLPGAIAKAVEGLKGLVAGVREFTNAFRTGMTEDEGTPLENFALRLRSAWYAAKGLFAEVAGGVRSFIAAFKNGFGETAGVGEEVAGITTIERFGITARNVWEGIKKTFADIMQGVEAFKNGFARTAGVGEEVEGATTIERFALKLREAWDKIKVVFDDIDKEDVKSTLGALAAGVATFAASLTAFRVAMAGMNLLANLPGLFAVLASPIGIAAIAITALVAAAVLAYQKIPLFRDAVDAVAKAFKDGGFGKAVDEAAAQFDRLWPVFKEKLDEFLDKAGAWIVANGPNILRGLRDAWLTFAGWMATEFWPYLLGKLGSFLASFEAWAWGTAWPAIIAWLAEWGKAFGNWVNETAIPWLSEKLPGILGAIGAWIRDEGLPAIREKIKVWGTAFIAWIDEEAIPKIKEKLPGIVDAIASWVAGTALPALKEFGDNMARELLKFAGETALKLPGELVKINLAILNWALSLMLSIPGWVVDIGIAIIEGILTGAKEKLADLLDWFREMPNKIIHLVKGAFGISSPSTVFMDIGRDIIEGLLDGVKAAIGAVKDFFTNLGGDVVGWVGNAASWLIGKGGDIIEGLLKGITGAIGDVYSFFANLGGDVVRWVGDAYSWLIGKGGDVIRGFIDGVKNWIGSIAGHIANIGSTVQNAIGDTGSWLYDKGRSLIQGFINGIESLAGRAESAASRVISAAASAIPFAGQIAGLLPLAAGGIVTRPTIALIGEAGPEAVIPLSMFNQGVQFGRYPTYPAAPATGGTTGGTTVNVYAQTNADSNQIARDMSWALLTRSR